MLNDRLALALAGTRHFTDIDLKRFRRFAERVGLPVRLVVKTAAEVAQAVRDHWSTHEPLRMRPKRIRKALANHIKTCRYNGICRCATEC